MSALLLFGARRLAVALVLPLALTADEPTQTQAATAIQARPEVLAAAETPRSEVRPQPTRPPHPEVPTPDPRAVDFAAAGGPAVRSGPADVVAWTITRPRTLGQLSSGWGVPRARLVELNPQVDPREVLMAGTRVRVHDPSVAGASRSVGAPNRGRLVRGIPMPEGEAWTLKAGRRNTYGTAETVAALHGVLLAYASRFGSAQPVGVRDLSARKGGRIRPHRSHQSGRDVDIAFVLEPRDDGSRRVNAKTFDREKNWFLVRGLIDRGQVQAIYMSGNAKRWTLEAAQAELPAEVLPRYFDRISYEPGHGHHMHVRFQCPEGDGACRARSR